jgi:hypothetical protein
MTAPVATVLEYPSKPASATLLFTTRILCAALAAADLAAVLLIALRRPGGVTASTLTPALAYFVIAAIALAFVAVHRRATQRPRTFVAVVLAICAAQSAVLATLFFAALNGAAAILPAPFTTSLFVITLAVALSAALIAHRAATENLLLQSAHRAFSIALWVLVARIALAVWNRPLELTKNLLPISFMLFAWSAVAPLALLWLRSPYPETYKEAKPLARAAAIFLLTTLTWLIVSTR